ncbi:MULTISPECIES: PD40 domain-containing protein, partial [unclassified Imperialibacter]|uniref:PD40 domain-containing protein n=1 Tax=unclassified Imperialibacter TaxID=2629706 RepID=UPI00125EFF8D
MKNILQFKVLLLVISLTSLAEKTASAQKILYSSAFDATNGWKLLGNSVSLSTDEGSPQGITFRPDGLKMYIVGNAGDEINQYSLATPFVTTGGITNDGTPFSVAAQLDNPYGMAFSNDGLTMFVTGSNSSNTHGIYQYSLTTPFNITSGVSFEYNYPDDSPYLTTGGIYFSPDGTKLFLPIATTGQPIRQYTLTNPFDVGSGVTLHTSVNTGIFQMEDISLSYDGKKIYVISRGTGKVYQITLNTAFDLAGGIDENFVELDFSGQESHPGGLFIHPAGHKAYVIGYSQDKIFEYGFNLEGFAETSENDGSVEGSVELKIVDDLFTSGGGSLTYNVDYSISNLPPNLTPSLNVASDGQSAILTLSGSASYHQNTNDIQGLRFNFNNSAFVENDAADVFNAQSADSGIGIDFEANVEVTFGNAFSLIDGATFNNSAALYAASTDDYPRGLAFNADGTRMYVVGPTDKEIYMLSVSTPFRPDLGYGVGFTPFSVSSEDVSPKDIAFSADGLKMFVLGHATKRIFEYNLTNPFNISSGTTYSGSYFSASSLDSAPTSIALSQDGSKMFLTGATGDKVYQINLAIPFSISTATNSGNFVSVSAQETNPVGVKFNTEGTRMFVYGTASNAVHQYSLQNPFDLSSGVTASNVSVNVSPEGAGASGFTFAGDGKSFIFSTYQKLAVYTLAKDGFKESPDNDGNVAGRLVTNVRFDTFVNAGSTLSIGTHYSLSAAPAGLTPVMTVAGDGQSATLTFTGTATSHQDENDIDEIDITFTDAAFSNSDAADVLNATNGPTGFGVDFNDNIPALAYGSRLDLATDSPKLSSTYDVTGETSSSLGMSFSNNGMRLFIADYAEGAIYQYNLTTPFDISSGVSYSGHSFDVSNQEPQPTDVDFNADGTKMYVSGGSDDLVQYSLLTPFDISSFVSLDGIFDLSNDVSPSGVAFSHDGSKLYMIGSQTDKIYQYSLATPYDVTADVTFDGTPYSTTNYNYTDIDISEDGHKIFLTNSSYPGSTQTREFDLTVPFDIAGGVTPGGSFNFFKYDPHAQDIHLSPDGKRLFMLGAGGKVFQFELPYDGFREVAVNDGTVEGEMLISIIDEQFANAGSLLSHGADYTILNLPSGLTPVMDVAGNGKTATLTLTGKASAHQDANDISDISFTFNNSAFAGGSAAAVANASNASSSRAIDFRDNQPSLSYGNVLDMTHATSGGTPLDVSGQDSYPVGLAFSSNGMKLFVLGGDNYTLYQYTLTTAYDITAGVSYSQAYDLSAQVSGAEDLAFSSDGMRMFILDNDNYEVYQYNLGSAFDITTGVTYSGNSFNYESYDTSVYGFTFSPDGTKMIIAGTSENYDIFQFTLGGAFDLSTAPSFDGNSLNTEDVASPTGLAFSEDGRYLIMTDDNNDYEVVRYILNQPFDITAGATFDGNYFSLDDYSIYGTAIAIKPDGSKVFVADGDNSLIQQFNIDLGGFAETGANDGSLSGEMNIFLVDDKFSSAGSSLTYSTDYTITNLPGGLIADLAVAADGYSAVLSFTGKASVHQDAADIAGLIFTFDNSAFVNSTAANVNHAVNTDSHIGIDFLINTENDILSFVLTQQTGPATIDDVDHTVTMEVNAGTSPTSLAPTITLSDGATSNPVSGMSQNFTSAVNYTVTAEDGTEQVWGVTITEQQVAPTDILLSEITIDENNSVGDVIGTLSAVDGNTSQTH